MLLLPQHGFNLPTLMRIDSIFHKWYTMAAVGLVSVENSVGPGYGLSTGHGSGPGPGHGPGAWNRSLDRALEEGAITGCLNLSGRKLKEFPRSAANHDLTDTIQADLSRNRLSDISAEICQFVSLESLNLYQNCIRFIPEAVLNLQTLTCLNVSRNQLSTLPAYVCSLPLKVLIVSNNKLLSLPEEIGQLRHLTELDVSCNEIQTLPPQIGNLESLRDLNIRRNHLLRLPEELAELPLVRLDFSCNKITSIPVCYRNLRYLQAIILDNNPLQSPPAQICIKGKVHIFKYLKIHSCKITPDPQYFEKRPDNSVSCQDELYPRRSYGGLDSGFNSVDSGDKRWSGNEPTEDLADLPLRVAEIKEQRLRRECQYHENRGTAVLINGGVENDLDQIDYIDSCTMEEEEEDVKTSKQGAQESLSFQFMAYIGRRMTHEPASGNELQRIEDSRRYIHLNKETEELRRPETLDLWHDRLRQQALRSQTADSERFLADGAPGDHLAQDHYQMLPAGSSSYLDWQRRREQMVERTRREAQLAALQYEEERMRTKQIQREAVLGFVKLKNSQSPHKQIPMDSENEDRYSFSVNSPTNQTASPSSRSRSHLAESFLNRAALRDEMKQVGTSSSPAALTCNSGDVQSRQNTSVCDGEEELIEQLRKNIESRLKVSLPNELGPALTDGVVLCHLANHVRPRSVPSIHVPSPAVPKLTMAKCRRNVENFLEACRKIGVPQDIVCSSTDVLQLNLLTVNKTVEDLLELGAVSGKPALAFFSLQLAGFAVFYCTVMIALYKLYSCNSVF
ncbi:DISP complex protein LRCH3 isoform X2 [Protopterus annectens]|uniref:DISP complex protein LRCH3 isoform X2 n=1 Tax=Protopterus annectens TaxID=7888 RepID=UPI001CFAF844|nr:DISP complex protein LRCH3 isoform X2 [Protopterus annectens]